MLSLGEAAKSTSRAGAADAQRSVARVRRSVGTAIVRGRGRERLIGGRSPGNPAAQLTQR
jgi:hypothetical protein